MAQRPGLAAANGDAVRNRFSDSSEQTFFWRAHTVSVLVICLAILVYEVFVDDTARDLEANVKRSMVMCVFLFVCFGITQARDGPFTRPHPAFWRLVLCLCVIYELILVFLLFQNIEDARTLLAYVDQDLGRPLPEQSYAQDCTIYDLGNPADPLHNFWDKCDFFIFAHIAGFMAKAFIIRDIWLVTVISILFELLEYSLEHQLPNFAECWWDHWILDCLVCNLLGMLIGICLLKYLDQKTYHWRSLWQISTYKGKVKRVFAQFTPYFWTEFHWRPQTSLRRWLAVWGIIGFIELSELNVFYLKFILWIPPPHWILLVRTMTVSFGGAVALHEVYTYLESNSTSLGQQAWIIGAIVATETMIVLKFGSYVLLLPFPGTVLLFWLVVVAGFLIYTFSYFIIPSLFRVPVSSGDTKTRKKRFHASVKNCQKKDE